LTISSSTRSRSVSPPTRAGDRRGRLEAAHGPLELGPARVDDAVQARVLDRDRRPVGKHDDRVLVLLVELAAGLLGEVQVAPRLAADQDRHAEERPHRRVAGREAVRARVLAEVREAQRPRLLDEQAEDPAPAWQVADGAVGSRVHAAGEELRELAPALVEDAERGVPRAGEFARGLEHAVEHDVEVQLRQEAAADLDEADEAVVIAGGVEHRDEGPRRLYPRPGGPSGRPGASPSWCCGFPRMSARPPASMLRACIRTPPREAFCASSSSAAASPGSKRSSR
jgi:hypothetical protein